MKLKKMLLAATVLSMAMSGTAFAGTWRTGAEPNQNRWWYDNGNGTFANNGWQWIDGNNDGIAECYYFDADGWMLANTTTSDGYQVNENGAWVENNVIQTKTQEPQKNASVNVSNGEYYYYKTALYTVDSNNNLAPFAETALKSTYNEAHEERMNLLGIRAAADFYTIISVTDSSDSNMTWGYCDSPGFEPFYTYDCINSNGFWYYDADHNGTLSEEEKQSAPVIVEDSNTITLYQFDTVQDYEANAESSSLCSKYGWSIGTPIGIGVTYKKDIAPIEW